MKKIRVSNSHSGLRVYVGGEFQARGFPASRLARLHHGEVMLMPDNSRPHLTPVKTSEGVYRVAQAPLEPGRLPYFKLIEATLDESGDIHFRIPPERIIQPAATEEVAATAVNPLDVEDLTELVRMVNSAIKDRGLEAYIGQDGLLKLILTIK